VKTTLALLLLAAAPARALDPWTWQDTAWEATFISLVLIDVGETRALMDGRHHELNPIVGPHPSESRLVGLAFAGVVTHAGVAYLLPHGWRRGWQAIGIGIEVAAVGHNATLGLRLSY